MMSEIGSMRMPPSVARWLAAKSDGERRAIAVLLIAAMAALLWVAVWQPIVRDVHALLAVRSGNAAELSAARKMAEEGAGLARGSATAPGDARAGLERILVQQGLRPSVTQLDWQDGRARLVFAAVGYDSLIAALEALQRDEKLRAVAATITARVEPGTVRAEITLAR
jgi:type II secretory pathway component PulM